jgi:hypothetical protein
LFVLPCADLFEEASTLEGRTIDDVGTISSKVNDSSNQACRMPSPRCGSRLGLTPRGAFLGATVRVVTVIEGPTRPSVRHVR